MTTTTDRDYALEVFRNRVLSALDEAAREIFNPPRNDAGATDADLPRLFKAIDAQVEALADRYRVVLTSYSPDAMDRVGTELAQSRAAFVK